MLAAGAGHDRCSSTVMKSWLVNVAMISFIRTTATTTPQLTKNVRHVAIATASLSHLAVQLLQFCCSGFGFSICGRRHHGFAHACWLNFSYKLVKMLSVCLDVNERGTNRNRCTHKKTRNRACTDLLMKSDKNYRPV